MDKDITLEQIYSLYMNDLYRYIYSLCKNKSLTEDIVQETFYRAYLFLEDYKYKEEKIKPWLFKVAYHTFIDVIRKEKRITLYDDLETLNTGKNQTQAKSAEQEFLIKHTIENWFEALDCLSLPKRNVVLLRDYYHFSYQEIADIFGISLANVKVTLFRGRREIKKLMADDNV